MYEIQRISIRSLGKLVMLISSSLYVLFGFAVTLLYGGIRSAFIGALIPNSVTALSFFLVWMAGLILVFPLAYLSGILYAALFNVFARWWGGLRVDLARIESKKPPEETLTANKKEPKKEQHHG